MRAIFIPIKSLFVAISFGLGWCGLFSAHMTLFNEGQNTVRETKLPLELNKLQYHGTTTLSFKHKDSLVLCVDSKASIGNYVGSRCVKKVFPVSANIVATMAGGAADCAYWIRRISRLKSMMEYKLDARLGARAVARMLSSSLREYKGQGTMYQLLVKNIYATFHFKPFTTWVACFTRTIRGHDGGWLG